MLSGGESAAWRFGGLYSASENIYGTDVERIPNTDFERVEQDGRVTASVTLPLPQGSYLSSGEVVDHESGHLLFANECEPPGGGEVFGCTGIGAVYEIDDDLAGVTRLPQDPGLAPGPFTVVGHDDERVWATVARGPGEIQFTSEVSLFSFSLGDRTWQEVDLPDGIVTPTSVCASRAHVYASAPQINDDLEVIGLDLHRLRDDADGTWDLVDSARFDAVPAIGGGVYCSDTLTLAVLANASAPTLLTRPDAGSFSEPRTLAGESLHSIATDSRSIVLGVADETADQYQLITVTDDDLKRVEFPATSRVADGGRPAVVLVGAAPYEGSASLQADVPLRPLSSGAAR